jgi:hypothetical protein
MVEGVEEVSPEKKRNALGNMRPLLDGEVPVLLEGAAECVPADVADALPGDRGL